MEKVVQKVVEPQTAGVEVVGGDLGPQPSSQEQLVKKIIPESKGRGKMIIQILVVVLVVLAGVGTGFLLARGSGGFSSSEMDFVSGVDEESKEKGVFGLAEVSAFKDTAEGVLKEGGIDGEGTHHLDRSELGPGKNVYLISTSVDLSQFVGKRVQVWGQTIAAKKAPWLMDVGRLKILE